MTDHAEQLFLTPQLSEAELVKILRFLHRRLDTAEHLRQWSKALELTRRQQTVLELLARRQP